MRRFFDSTCRLGTRAGSLIVLTAFVFFIPDLLQSQDGSNSRIDRLRGGNVGVRFNWSGEMFSGLGTRADAMGGSISTLYPAGDLISSNPAGLGFARGFQFTLDWAPPLNIDPGGIFSLENRLNDALIETAKNNNPPRDPETGGLRPDSVVTDAAVSTNLSMRGGLKGGAVMYGTPYFSIGASFHQPLQIESQINISGTEFLAAALDDEGKETNRIFGTMNGNSNLLMNIESTSIAVATQRLIPKVALGMAYDNFDAEMNFEGTFLPEGIISSTGGDTRFFNDPARLQYDSLFVNLRGDWAGNGDRLRWGIGYHPVPNISLDAVLALPFSMQLSGPFDMVHNNIRALNLNAAENEEVFDIDILVEDNLTKTEKIVTNVPGMEIKVPGTAAFGFSSRWDRIFVISLVYVNYLDELSYRFAYTSEDSLGNKKQTGEIKQGVEISNAFRLGIGVMPLMVGTGVIFGEAFTEVSSSNDPTPDTYRENIFIPLFSLGGSVDIGSHFRFDYIVTFMNSSFLRFSTSYRF